MIKKFVFNKKRIKKKLDLDSQENFFYVKKNSTSCKAIGCDMNQKNNYVSVTCVVFDDGKVIIN